MRILLFHVYFTHFKERERKKVIVLQFFILFLFVLAMFETKIKIIHFIKFRRISFISGLPTINTIIFYAYFLGDIIKPITSEP